MNRPCVLSFLLLSSNLDLLTAQIPGDQVRQEWVVRYAALASAIAVDPVGNVYVPGSPTIKLDSQGNTVWIARYTAAFTDIAVDARGNVYVTGWDSNSKGYATIKYDPQGNLVWIARSTNTSRAIALDVAGNVYVAGAMWSENRLDYATTKYDPQGNEMWVARYHGPLVYGSEEATAIAVDAKGNVYVTGGSHPASNAAAYATVKYDPDGNEIWVGRYNADRASAIALDPVGNVYVAGESTSLQDRFGTFHDFFMIKYDPDGTLVWLATYDSGLFNDDRAKGIAVDVTGNVYVTGTSRRDYITLKLDRNGNRVWVARYDGGWADEANDIAVDPAGNVYVTGWSNKGDTDETADYVTIKYDPAGEQVWLARYDGPGKGHDEAAALALDSAGNVYVTGMSRNESLDFDSATIKYSQSPLPAFTTSLYFPRLVSDPNESTGIALVNLDSSEATLRFTAFDRNGSAINGSNITNPASRTLNAASQIPIMDAQVFGEGLASSRSVGWLKVESTVRRIAGFFLIFDSALTFLDGADVSSATLTTFVFPEIETPSDGFTQIHIANPNSTSTQTTLELVRSGGSVHARADRTIAPNGSTAELLTELFPGVTPESSDYIQVTASQGVAAFELLGRSGRFVHGLNGQDRAFGATTLYSPQYVVGGSSWGTTLSVVNLDDSAGTVTFRFIGDDGTIIGTQQRQIPPRGKLFIGEQSFFLSPGTQMQGYVEITSSGPRLTGSVVFGDQARSTFSSALPLAANLRKDMIFAQVASAEGSSPSWFTGLALLNAGSTDASAMLQVFDENGAMVASGHFVVAARRRLSQLLTQYFPDLVGRNILKGYIRVTTDQPLASFGLFGTTSLSVLSAVPPQVVP